MPNKNTISFFFHILWNKVIPITVLIWILMLLSASIPFSSGSGLEKVLFSQMIAILLPTFFWSIYQTSAIKSSQGSIQSKVPTAIKNIFGKTIGFWRLLIGSILFAIAWSGTALFILQPIFEKWFPPSIQEQNLWNTLFHIKSTIPSLFISLFCFALLPAFCEELFYRGLLFSLFLDSHEQSIHQTTSKEQNTHLNRNKNFTLLSILTLLFTSFLFGVFHFSIAKMLPTTFLGLGFGFARLLSNSTWPSIVMHFINNASILFIAFWINQKRLYLPSAIVVLGIIVLGSIGIWLLYIRDSKHSIT